MADEDQSKSTSDQDQSTETSPTKEQFDTLQKQVGELTSALAESQKQTQEAIRGLHDKAQDAASLRKELDEREARAKSAIDGKTMADIMDDGEKMAKFLAERDAEMEKRITETVKGELSGVTKELVDWGAGIQKTVEETRKLADPRFRDSGFQEWKGRLFKDSGIPDEQLLEAYERDKGAGNRPPVAPGGSASPDRDEPAKTTDDDDIKKSDGYKLLWGPMEDQWAAEDMKRKAAENAT